MTQHNPAAKLYCGATANVSQQIKVAWCHSGRLSTEGTDRPFFRFGITYASLQALASCDKVGSKDLAWVWIYCQVWLRQTWLMSVCTSSYLEWVKAGNNSPVFNLAALGWMCKLAFFIAAWTVSPLELPADFQGQPLGVSNCRNVHHHLQKAAIAKGFFCCCCSDSCMGLQHTVKL